MSATNKDLVDMLLMPSSRSGFWYRYGPLETRQDQSKAELQRPFAPTHVPGGRIRDGGLPPVELYHQRHRPVLVPDRSKWT